MHRDGTVLGLSPFLSEYHRRIWWQINHLEFEAAEHSGYGNLGDVNWWNTRLPSNVNDVDLRPDMKEPPVEAPHPTEMVACLLRYETGSFWKRKLLPATAAEEDLTPAVRGFVATASISEKDAFVNEFEQNLEQKFLN